MFRRMGNLAGVVLFDTSTQIAGDPNLIVRKVIYASKDVDVGHFHVSPQACRAVARRCNGPPSPCGLRRGSLARFASEGWWWSQSVANSSLREFPDKQGIDREYVAKWAFLTVSGPGKPLRFLSLL
jgi:hypothetical protein